MIIIVEGPNGTGKTTLCNELKKEFNLEYIKLPIPKDGFNSYLKWSKELDNCILDRFYYSEFVYPFFKNDGRTSLTLNQIVEIEKILRKKLTFLIYTNTFKESKINTFKNERENEESFIKEIDIEDKLFYTIYHISSLQRTKYNYEVDSKIILFNKIKKFFNIKE